MAADGSIKIQITSDSSKTLKDLQKIEQQSKKTFERAQTAARKTEIELQALEKRRKSIANSKRAELDIGIKWNPAALDAAVDKALEADKEFMRLSRRIDTLQIKQEVQEGVTRNAAEAHECAARSLNEYTASTQEAGQAVGNLNSSNRETQGASEQVKSSFDRVKNALARIVTSGSKAEKGIKGVGKEAKSAKKHIDPLSKSVGKLGVTFLRMALFTIMRKAIREMINAAKEGVADLAKHSASLQAAMNQMTTAFFYVRNAGATMLKPVLEAIAPVVDRLADAFATLADKAAQFFTAILGGTGTYKKAKKVIKEYGDEAKKTAESTDKATASFDDLNQLSFDGQSDKSNTLDTDMFEDAGIEESVQSLADRVKEVFAEIKAYVLDIAEVFKQSWGAEGLRTLEAMKGAFAAILGLVLAVGESFHAVWTNGTGLTLLNTIQMLLQTILGIIASVANAFVAAWESGDLGNQVIEAILGAITAVLSLIISIGQAFKAAWDGGAGEAIWTLLLQIVKNVFDIIRNLAQGIQSAWEASGNGEAIWSAILGLVQIVLGFFERITRATAEWASNVNWEPLVSSLRHMLDALNPLVDLILGGLAWAYENVLLPLASWAIEAGAPALVDLLTAAFQGLAAILETLGPLIADIWDLIKPLVQFMGTKVVDDINKIMGAITLLCEIIAGVIELAQEALQAIKSLGAGFSFGGSSSGGASSGGGSARSASAAAPRAALAGASVPMLATGAVIPPNNEFLAVLGDQKSGTNIEAPLDTIKQGLAEVLAEQGGMNGGDLTIHIKTDDNFTRHMKFALDKQNTYAGVKLVQGG